MNPDEVVAVGAAIQAGNLQGDIKGELLLLDVTPLSLGIETMGGIMTKVIERNTTIPTSKSQIFSTAADGQTSVEVHVLQGERELAGDNRSLGRFTLSGIPSAPRGVPQVEVSFDLDANGILSVKAKDKATNKEQQIVITASTNLSKDEVERMRKEAELHAEEDKQKREGIEVKNMAETMIYTTEKMLKENAEKIKPEDKTTIDAKIDALKAVKDGDDLEAIKKAADELATEAQKAGASLYQTRPETETPPPPAGDASTDGSSTQS